jgi:hypothetical protein
VSNEAITWAYQQRLTPGAKFVLVALADMADEQHSCFPGQAKLAAMTGQGERTVRRQLLELEVAGYVSRARRFDKAGHRTSDRYVLPVGQSVPTGQDGHRPNQPAAKLTTGQTGHRPTATVLPANGDSPTGQDGQVSLREPSLEPSDSSSSELRPDVDRLCQHLADRIEANGSKRPTITARWRNSARLLLDVDHRTEQQIRNAIDWCQADEFWRTNILSMPKLREKYDQLRLAAARPTGRASPRSTADTRAADALALAQRLRIEETG